MNIAIISVAISALKQIEEIHREWQEGPRAERFSLELCYVGSDSLKPEDWPEIFAAIVNKDMVLVDLMGAPRDFTLALIPHLEAFEGHIAVLNSDLNSLRGMARLGEFLPRDMASGEENAGPMKSMEKMQVMLEKAEKMGKDIPPGKLKDFRNLIWLGKYWRFCSRDNIRNMLLLLGRDYGGYDDLPEYAPPVAIEEICILDPLARVIYPGYAEYAASRPSFGDDSDDKPRAALLFSHSNYPVDTYPAVGAFIRKIQQYINVIPIAMARTGDVQKLGKILHSSRADIIISLLAFRLGQGPMGGDAQQVVELLKELELPVLHPFFLSKSAISQWKENTRGLKPAEFLIYIYLPELDGCLETYPLGAMSDEKDRAGELALIEDRADRLMRRVLQWTGLKKKNREKKVAIIFYDYPPGEGNVGSGAFLDTFVSLEAILRKLHDTGYDVTPLSADELRKKFIDEGRTNSPQWKIARDSRKQIIVTSDTYSRITKGCPYRCTLEKVWGVFPGTIMDHEKGLVIPGIINGNIFLGIQPSRGYYEMSIQNYHDKCLFPHHQYTAFYKWLEQEFKADLCLHVGTHGTMEFLPGKESAMSGECSSDYLIGVMPHLYIYYVGNPAEAMIAKRRAHAVMISHQHPPFVESELYGEMSLLENLLAEYEEAVNLDASRCDEILADIRASMEKLGWTWNGLEELSRNLYEMKTSLIPGRLHVFGQGYSLEEAENYLLQLYKHEDAGRPSLPALICREQGWKWEEIRQNSHLYQDKMKILLQKSREWIKTHIILEQAVLNKIDKELEKAYILLQNKGLKLKGYLLDNRELDALVGGMQGKYLEAGMGGDIFRDPEILPTGRNIYQFDPRRVPTPSALRRGKEIAENTLKQYLKANDKYPISTALVLWGLETSKTQGETVGQILTYLGIKLKSEGNSWEPVLEVVPPEQLGRPRIDVKVQICGFFRDMFPNIIELLNDIFAIVENLQEEDSQNYVKSNTKNICHRLREMGMKEEEAREFSLARIFGPETAQYGTGVNRLVKSKRWQMEGELASDYINSLSHVYTKEHYGKEVKGLLECNLEKVEMISQVRSSRDYEITDLDHYYEYFGGLAKTVEELSGKKAAMFISDTHEGKVRTETVDRSIQRGVRTRLFNPRWLDGMLQHDYHGGQQLADRMENLLGLAATTGEVDNRVFDEANDRFVLDKEMRERIEKNNLYALREIMERLLEAEARGYWGPSPEKLAELKRLYLEQEGNLEEASDN